MREAFPLYDRFPTLRAIPRAEICTLPTPVERVSIGGGREMLIKRDDLSAPVCGGNKARSLEFLLGGLKPGDGVITVGGAGSTHVLSTAIHAARRGISTEALRWRHDMNPAAEVVSARVNQMLSLNPENSAALAVIRARYRATRSRARFISIGGSVPLGVLGHVNAAFEIAGQIERGEMPQPERIVLPLGSGGTTAGLLLGFSIAGLGIEITGARVGPRFFVNRLAVLNLARRTAQLIRAFGGKFSNRIDSSLLRIEHSAYGGAYGRQFADASRAADVLHEASGIKLDDTYSAKAWLVAMREQSVAKGHVLFLLTFDARCLTN